MATVFEVLKARGFPKVDAKPYTLIELWKSWYQGDVADFHRYKIFNGQASIQARRYTVGMAKKVAEDWASLLMNEKVSITLSGENEQKFVDAVLKEANFRVRANELEEYTAALGTSAFVPRVVGAELRADGSTDGGVIKLDYCTADKIVPLSWENGKIIECAFMADSADEKGRYAYIQIHRLNEEGLYDIENLLYENRNGSLKEIRLSEVDEYATLAPVVHTGSDKPQFIINRLNIANNIEIGSPMGISVYANAIDQLKGVDIAYDSYVNEFILGKKRIFLRPEFLKTIEGESVFDPSDTSYYLLPGEDGNTGVQEIDMSLRTAEHNAGIQDMLNVLSAKCGFGENHYRFDRGSIQTATQIISENSSLYRNVQKHEIILHEILEDLCRTLLRIGNNYQHAGLDENVEITIDFDDSIIEDKATERANDRLDVEMRVMSRQEYRAKWYNEDEQTAAAALPPMEELVSE